MESNAFNDAFTTNHGGSCFFVSVDPAFDTQIAEAASLVARSRPADSRNEFTSSLVESARAAQPPAAAAAAEEGDEEEESKKASVDTPETVEKKRAVLKELFAALKEGGNKLESVQSDREFEGWSNLVLSLSLSLLEGEDLAAAVETLTATYTTLPSTSSTSTSSASPIPSLPARYTALATLFNALPSTSSTSKLSTLTALVSFASSNDDSAVLSPTLLSLPAIFSALSLSPAEADETVLSIAQALASQGAQSEARKVLESHLSAAKKNSEKTEQKGKLADLLVALSLSAPDVYDFTPLSALPSPPSNGDLASLLSIFLRGDLSVFSSLSSSLPNVGVEGVELKKDQLEKKIKLVKLAELCSERVGETVGYKEIQEVLGLKGGEDEGEEVETWVIDAIRASLLSGRLSQPTQSLSITRALPPSSSSSGAEGGLDVKYWKLIQERLEGWKERVGRVGESARRAQGQANGGAGGREERGGKGEEIA